MIKLELKAKPEKLTDELVKSKTQKYNVDNTQQVWNIDWLKAPIRMKFCCGATCCQVVECDSLKNELQYCSLMR